MFVAFSTAVKASYMRVPLPGNGTEPSVTRTTEVPFRVHYQKNKLHSFPQFFKHIFLQMSRKYVSLFNEEYVLDQ